MLNNEIHVHSNVIALFNQKIRLYLESLNRKETGAIVTLQLIQFIVTLIIGIPITLVSLFHISKRNN